MKIYCQSLLILAILCVTGTLCAAQTGTVVIKDVLGNTIGSYGSITLAYNALPTPLASSYQLLIDTGYHGTLEPHPIVLGPKAGASAANQIAVLIKPTASCTGLGITGDITTAPVLVLDGAQWMTFNGQRCGSFMQGLGFFGSTTTTSDPALYPVIVFRNGASNNTFINCYFFGTGFRNQSNAATILLDTTTAGRTGNNHNTITSCLFFDMDSLLRSAGTPTMPNTGNSFSGNHIESCNENVVTIGPGTSGMTVENNDITVSGYNNRKPFTGILATHLQDTLRIRNNAFYLTNGLDDTSITAMHLQPATSAADHYAMLDNNFVGYEFQYGSDYISPSPDSVRAIIGIAVSGTAAIHAAIRHNTVRFGHTVDTLAISRLYSAAIRYTGHPGNQVAVLNNLFINERHGGGSSSQHLAADYPDTTGLSSDFNTYNAAAGSGYRAGSAMFNTFGDYHLMLPARDSASNDTAVRFDDFHSEELLASMYQNPGLQGVLLPEVPLDRGLRMRSFPYRGSYEMQPNCNISGVSTGGTVYSRQDSACANVGVYLFYTPRTTSTVVYHNWQRSPAGLNSYTDITGAITRNYQTRQMVATDYRMKDSCAGNGTVRYSPALRITMRSHNPGTLSLSAQNNYTVSFTVADRNTDFTHATWYFGDGDSLRSLADIVSHLYSSAGVYNVQLVSGFACAQDDTLHLQITVTRLGIVAATADQLWIYPSPAHDLLTIDAPAAIRSVAVMDAMGRVVQQQDGANASCVLRTTALPDGPYFLRVMLGNSVVYHAFSVAH